MKLTVTLLKSHPLLGDTRSRLSYMLTGGFSVQTRPNIGAVFGRTNNTFGGTLSYVLPLFSSLVPRLSRASLVRCPYIKQA